MSFRHTIVLSAAALAAALISQFALAGNPPPGAHGTPVISHSTKATTPKPITQEIGVVEAVVEFCAKVDPKNKSQFEKKALQVLPKLSEDSLEAARRTADYHAGYNFIQTILKDLSKTDAAHNCSAVL